MSKVEGKNFLHRPREIFGIKTNNGIAIGTGTGAAGILVALGGAVANKDGDNSGAKGIMGLGVVATLVGLVLAGYTGLSSDKANQSSETPETSEEKKPSPNNNDDDVKTRIKELHELAKDEAKLKEEIPRLREALGDKDENEHIRAHSAILLGDKNASSGFEESSELLLKHLDDNSKLVRGGCISGLGGGSLHTNLSQSKLDTIETKLIKKLKADESAFVRLTAVITLSALKKSGDKFLPTDRAKTAMKELLKDNPSMSDETISLLYSDGTEENIPCGAEECTASALGTLVQHGTLDEVIDLVVMANDNTLIPKYIWQMSSTLDAGFETNSYTKKVSDAVNTCLRHPEQNYRLAAVKVLVTKPRSNVSRKDIESLEKRLSDSSKDIRLAAIAALGDICSDWELLESEDSKKTLNLSEGIQDAYHSLDEVIRRDGGTLGDAAQSAQEKIEPLHETSCLDTDLRGDLIKFVGDQDISALKPRTFLEQQGFHRYELPKLIPGLLLTKRILALQFIEGNRQDTKTKNQREFARKCLTHIAKQFPSLITAEDYERDIASSENPLVRNWGANLSSQAQYDAGLSKALNDTLANERNVPHPLVREGIVKWAKSSDSTSNQREAIDLMASSQDQSAIKPLIEKGLYHGDWLISNPTAEALINLGAADELITHLKDSKINSDTRSFMFRQLCDKDQFRDPVQIVTHLETLGNPTDVKGAEEFLAAAGALTKMRVQGDERQQALETLEKGRGLWAGFSNTQLKKFDSYIEQIKNSQTQQSDSQTAFEILKTELADPIAETISSHREIKKEEREKYLRWALMKHENGLRHGTIAKVKQLSPAIQKIIKEEMPLIDKHLPDVDVKKALKKFAGGNALKGSEAKIVIEFLQQLEESNEAAASPQNTKGLSDEVNRIVSGCITFNDVRNALTGRQPTFAGTIRELLSKPECADTLLEVEDLDLLNAVTKFTDGKDLTDDEADTVIDFLKTFHGESRAAQSPQNDPLREQIGSHFIQQMQRFSELGLDGVRDMLLGKHGNEEKQEGYSPHIPNIPAISMLLVSLRSLLRDDNSPQIIEEHVKDQRTKDALQKFVDNKESLTEQDADVIVGFLKQFGEAGEAANTVDQAEVRALLDQLAERDLHVAFNAIQKAADEGKVAVLETCLKNPIKEPLREDIVRNLGKLKNQSSIEPILQFLQEDIHKTTRLADRVGVCAFALSEIGVPKDDKERIVEILENTHKECGYQEPAGQFINAIKQSA